MKVWIGLKSDQQRSLCADICSYSKQRGEGSAFQHCGCLIWLLEGGASPLLQNQPEPHCSLQCTWPSSGWGNLKLFLAAMTKLKTCCSSGPYRASLILQEEQAAVNLEVFWLFNLSHHCNTPCTKIRQLKYQHRSRRVSMHHPRGPVLEQRFFQNEWVFNLFSVSECLGLPVLQGC